MGGEHPDPPPTGQGPPRKRQRVSGGRRASPGVLLEARRRSSVGPAAGFQVRPFAGGQHPGMVSWLRKRPLVAPPVGPSAVPLADVPIQNVLDVLHNQVDGNCGRQTRAAQPPPLAPRLWPEEGLPSPTGHTCPGPQFTWPRSPARWFHPPGAKSQQTRTSGQERDQTYRLVCEALCGRTAGLQDFLLTDSLPQFAISVLSHQLY